MKTLKVCVCDDDMRSLATYAAAVKSCFQVFGMEAEVETYHSAANVRARMEKFSYDIIFLDIDMPGEDGIAFAKSLRKISNHVPIIFVTAREDRMFDTFAVQPFGFVRKSKFIEDLNEAVRLFLEANPDMTAEMIMFSTQSGDFRVNAKQVIYIESRLHSQYIHLNGQPDVELRLSMNSIESALSDKGFIRIHKGYIVNYRYIKRIENNDVCLITGGSLPLSRDKKKEVKALWLEYGLKNGFTYLENKQ